MTGTPLDLTLFGPLPGAIGLLYWLLAAAVVAFALWYSDRLLLKLPHATTRPPTPWRSQPATTTP